jgi:enoyl-CoA hydratase/carnithine racemase
VDTCLIPYAEYSQRFEHLDFQRSAGVLQVTQHSEHQSLRWGGEPQAELGAAFRFIAADRDNKVVIFTGAGHEWNGPPAIDEQQYRRDPDRWDLAIWNGTQLQMALLDIPVPVIAAVNGPVHRHVEIPLLSDVVLAAEDATFDDRGHFPVNLTAGDGVFAATSFLMGHNRARYFHLTGQILSAQQAHGIGLVAEVLPKDQVLSRAQELAAELAAKPLLTLRYQRAIFTHALKRAMLEQIGQSFALEGLAAMSEQMPPPPRQGVSSSVY